MLNLQGRHTANHWRENFQRSVPPVLFSAIFLLVGDASASTEIQPYVSVGEIYTSNVFLQSDDRAQDEFITQIIPGISLARRGARVDTDLDYRIQGLYYSNLGDTNVYHQADGKLTWRVIQRSLDLDALVNVSQSIIDPTATVPSSNLSITSNRTNLRTFGLRPRFHHEFGNYAILDASILAKKIRYDSASVPDSDSYKTKLNLGSGTAFTKFSWTLRASEDRQEYDFGAKRIFRKYHGELAWPAEPNHYQLLAVLGRESNDYPNSAIGASVPSGRIWKAGVRLFPSSRVKAEFTYGRRFFGRTLNGYLTIEGARNRLHVMYKEELRTFASLVLSPRIEDVAVVEDRFAIDPSQPAISANVYLQKRLNLSFLHRFSRSSLLGRITRERRDYQDQDREEEISRIRLTWSMTLGKRTTGRLTAGFLSRDVQIANGDYDLVSMEARLERLLARDFSGYLSIRRYERKGEDPARDYKNEILTLSLVYSF